ncbi:MAG TPA: hypothetical protein VFP65_18080 [Anaeromyxobacteraceae bacterium]|nr:hypothetical protein [Anaeromyxobacteraceae bacterium]
MKVIHDAAQFLHETGLLAEINRVVLNPRGLALSTIAELPGPDPREEQRVASFGPLYDKRDDDGFVLPEKDLALASARLREREADGTVPVRPQREARLGFVVQPWPGEAKAKERPRRAASPRRPRGRR